MTAQWGDRAIRRELKWYESGQLYDHRGLKHPIHGCPCRPCMCAMAEWCAEAGVPMPATPPGG